MQKGKKRKKKIFMNFCVEDGRNKKLMKFVCMHNLDVRCDTLKRKYMSIKKTRTKKEKFIMDFIFSYEKKSPFITHNGLLQIYIFHSPFYRHLGNHYVESDLLFPLFILLFQAVNYEFLQNYFLLNLYNIFTWKVQGIRELK